jgi:prepilin-type processing-associated H-X9-DG protein
VVGGCGRQSGQSPVHNNHYVNDRDIGGAGFAFLDGHVKWTKVTVPGPANGYRPSDPPIAMFYGQ